MAELSDTVSPEEFHARRARAAKAARDRGLRGLLIWSRGGTSVDWYGDVLYLSNYYTPMPQIHDTAAWSGRGHAAVILPIDDEPVLIVDVPDYPREAIMIADVRSTVHVVETTAATLLEKGLDRGGLGLVGRQTLLLETYRALERELGHELEFESADDILAELRRLKSPSELQLMRSAAAIGVEWMSAMMKAVDVGRTEGEIVGEGLRTLAACGAHPYDVAVGSGPRSHEYQRVGSPSWDWKRPLEQGDLLHVDAWGPVEGYYTDFARSTVVGRHPTPEQRDVLESPISLVEHVMAGIKAGVIVGELFRSGEAWLLENGFGQIASHTEEKGTSFGEMFPAFGHCIGLGHEEPWITRDNAARLDENMVVAIEAFIGRPGVGAAGFEHNLIVTASGYELLTGACPSRWWD